MTRIKNTLITLLSLGMLSTASADITLSNFESFTLTGLYPSWDTATLISGPSSFTVQSSNFGGGYYDLDPNVDGSGESQIELDVTVNADTSPTVIGLLEDSDGTQYVYRWFSLPVGNNVLTAPLFPVPDTGAGYDTFVGNAGTTAGLDTSDLSFFHIQVDDPDAYDVSFNSLQLVPEPSSIALVAIGGLLLGLRRRR